MFSSANEPEFQLRENQETRPVKIKSFKRSPTKTEEKREKERGEVCL
jgi:hypothetical protein